MTTIRKIYLIFAILVVVVFLCIVGIKSELFLGKLVFFKDTPTQSTAVSGQFITYGEAVNFLLNAAVQAKRIEQNKIPELTQKYSGEFSKYQISRSEFARLAVEIFGLQYGYGTRYSDVPWDYPAAKDVYLFTSNIGSDEFKPANSATRSFVDKSIGELIKRFSP